MTGPHERPLAAEQLLTGYNVVMALIWAVFMTRVWYAPWLLLAHAAAVPLPWLFARAMPSASRPLRFLRELNPLLFLAVFWLELDLVRPVLGLTGIDGPVAALDRLMAGGVHLHQLWLPTMHGRAFSETMYGMYWAYYVAVYVPPIVLALMARHEPVRDMVFRLVLVYLGCYLVFIAFPVDGPHFLERPFQGPHSTGFFYGLVESAQGFGESRGCSFPSSHVAAAVMGAMLAWRWLPRWVAVVLWIEAIGVLLSTFYTQHHYAIDSVTGFAWAVGAWYLAGPLGRRIGATGTTGRTGTTGSTGRTDRRERRERRDERDERDGEVAGSAPTIEGPGTGAPGPSYVRDRLAYLATHGARGLLLSIVVQWGESGRTCARILGTEGSGLRPRPLRQGHFALTAPAGGSPNAEHGTR